MPPIKPVFYMVFITSLFISLEPTANFGNHLNLPVIANNNSNSLDSQTSKVICGLFGKEAKGPRTASGV